MAMSVEHRLKFTTLQQQWWRLHMNEIFWWDEKHKDTKRKKNMFVVWSIKGIKDQYHGRIDAIITLPSQGQQRRSYYCMMYMYVYTYLKLQSLTSNGNIY